ncbi:MAG: hypothetical protein CMP65_05665 [Flavobacteriales bacterium]|nr:hypothetical protein [Flavobacteriales bacterium]|tara:strand:- start:12715 stop:13749 length:1035 start_codon:yes stop_codon:yes gene_type:complete
MNFINKYLIYLLILILYSCSVQKTINYFDEEINPKKDFDININNFEIDYANKKNWAFNADIDDFSHLLPNRYKNLLNTKYPVDVFYIHPTTLFKSTNWNADTSFFNQNRVIEQCLENQASVFAGITNIYAPHYREMHIHSYSDTINGYKAFEVAYKDVLNAFKYYIKNINKGKFIIASHSQGTNHAKRLINEYISKDTILKNKLILSYLIGMDIHVDELNIPICINENDVNCFLTWRCFNEDYYPINWKYGEEILCSNPISYKRDDNWTTKNQHKGILLPNQKIFFKKTISAKSHQGLLWIKYPKNIFLKKYKSNSYHKADYNLFWVNMRENLEQRLSNLHNEY